MKKCGIRTGGTRLSRPLILTLLSSLFTLSSFAAGSATADRISLSGGTSIIDPTLLTAIFTGMAAVISAIGTLLWCNRRNARKQRPLDTDDTYVTHGECKSHRCALERRIDELGPALNRIFAKLSENDRKSEERSIQMHRRLDPVIEKVAANSAKIDIFEEIARKAAVK